MHDDYETFQKAGAEVVALAVAPISMINQGVREILKPPYPLLADPDHQVAEAFGVYNLLNDGYAAPAVFVIDTDGSIVWRYVGQGPSDRPSSNTILKQIP